MSPPAIGRTTLAVLPLIVACCAPDGGAPAAARERPPAAPYVIEGCPPDDAIAELHAAAFHFQNGPEAEARAHLLLAHELVGAAPGGKTRALLEQLDGVSRLMTTDAPGARNETEHVRLALGEWSCLREPLHRALHAALPPIPGSDGR